MTNETTASQPKSIGDDAHAAFDRFANLPAKPGAPIWHAFHAGIEWERSRAPAAQASATIQAAPEEIARLRTVQSIGFKLTAALCQIASVRKGGIDYVPREAIMDVVVDWRNKHDAASKVARAARPAATIQEPVMVAEPVSYTAKDEEEYIGHLHDQIESDKRKIVELQRVYDERGLQIGRLESALKFAAPMVADPAGVNALIDSIESGLGEIVTASHSGLSGTAANVRYVAEELEKEIDAYREAATVKAVPSEALAKLKRYPDSAGPGRGEMFRVVDVEALFAAPLADKTGGGQ